MHIEVYIIVGALLLVGVFISLPALLRPVRRLCRRNLAARSAVLCGLGLVSFVLGFGGLTRLEAQATYSFGDMTVVDTYGPGESYVTYPLEEYERAIVRELSARLLLPPLLRQRCYTSEVRVCTEADKLVHATSEQWGWSSDLADVGLGSVSAVVTIILAWLSMRRSKKGGMVAGILTTSSSR